MKTNLFGAIVLALSLALALPAQAAPKIPAELVAFEKSLNKQTGEITLPGAKATLHLGDRYYFLGPQEARKVLVDLWGNPPQAVEGVLGLVLPKDKTVLENVWGAVVTYDDSGYVADDDATTADYDQVLADMRSGEAERNAARKEAGYPASHLVGWAQPPSYEKASHSLIWARDFRIEGSAADSLNYDVRLLGRTGVLSLNMVSDMAHLPEVREAAAAFGKAASFDRGATYAEYDSSTDKTAEYGLAGLVAAGAGLAAAKKLGLLAIVLGFGKKFLILFAIAGAAIVRFWGKLTGRKRDDAEA